MHRLTLLLALALFSATAWARRKTCPPGGVAVVPLPGSSDHPQVFRSTGAGHRQREGRRYALIGIPLETAPGRHEASLSEDGRMRPLPFEIRPRHYPTQKLRIPDQRMVTPPPEVEARIAAEQAQITAIKRHFSPTPQPETGFALPASGRLSSRFGLRRVLNGAPRSPHAGLDLAVGTGTPVHAPGSRHRAGRRRLLLHRQHGGHRPRAGSADPLRSPVSRRCETGRPVASWRRSRRQRHVGPRHRAASALGGDPRRHGGRPCPVSRLRIFSPLHSRHNRQRRSGDPSRRGMHPLSPEISMRFMKPRPLFTSLLLSAALTPAFAETLSCPELRHAVQVGACPSEAELRFTFNGFCSADARAYGNDAELCIDYGNYRKRKNVSLWESGDGRFHAYVSCDLTTARVQAMAGRHVGGKERQDDAADLRLRDRRNARERVSFTHRTRDACHIDDTGACTREASTRKATCSAD